MHLLQELAPKSSRMNPTPTSRIPTGMDHAPPTLDHSRPSTPTAGAAAATASIASEPSGSSGYGPPPLSVPPMYGVPLTRQAPSKAAAPQLGFAPSATVPASGTSGVGLHFPMPQQQQQPQQLLTPGAASSFSTSPPLGTTTSVDLPGRAASHATPPLSSGLLGPVGGAQRLRPPLVGDIGSGLPPSPAAQSSCRPLYGAPATQPPQHQRMVASSCRQGAIQRRVQMSPAQRPEPALQQLPGAMPPAPRPPVTRTTQPQPLPEPSATAVNVAVAPSLNHHGGYVLTPNGSYTMIHSGPSSSIPPGPPATASPSLQQLQQPMSQATQAQPQGPPRQAPFLHAKPSPHDQMLLQHQQQQEQQSQPSSQGTQPPQKPQVSRHLQQQHPLMHVGQPLHEQLMLLQQPQQQIGCAIVGGTGRPLTAAPATTRSPSASPLLPTGVVPSLLSPNAMAAAAPQSLQQQQPQASVEFAGAPRQSHTRAASAPADHGGANSAPSWLTAPPSGVQVRSLPLSIPVEEPAQLRVSFQALAQAETSSGSSGADCSYVECSLRGLADADRISNVGPKLVEILAGLTGREPLYGLWKSECWRAVLDREGLAKSYGAFKQPRDAAAVDLELWLRKYIEPSHLRGAYCLRSYSPEHVVIQQGFPTNARRVKEATLAPSFARFLPSLGYSKTATNDSYVAAYLFHHNPGSTDSHLIVTLQRHFKDDALCADLFPNKYIVELLGRVVNEKSLETIARRMLEFAKHLEPYVVLQKM